MTQPQPPEPASVSSSRRVVWIALAAVAIVALAALGYLGLRSRGAAPQPTPTTTATPPAVAQLTATPTPMPTMTPTPVSTPICVQPTLNLGSAAYRIQPLTPQADGSLALPGDSPDVAYWVEGSMIHYVFVLSAAPANVDLQNNLQRGDPATIVWADCSEDSYVVETVTARVTADPARVDQSNGGMSVFVLGPAAGQGVTITGVRPFVLSQETPEPAEEDPFPADVEFLGHTASADGSSVTIGIALINQGAQPLVLAPGDISLAPEDGDEIPLVQVDPPLPLEIAPGASATLQLTFARPGINIAVLRILTLTIDYYF